MKFLLTITLSLFIFSSCNDPSSSLSTENETDKFILNEEFFDNSLGWVEENTSSHNVDISDGKYFIASLDTSDATFRSSAGSLDKSYLLGLPYSYEITSEMEFKSTDLKYAYFGIHMYSSSIQYIFSLYNDKELIIEEIDYNLDTTVVLVDEFFSGNIDEPIKFKIDIEGNDFQFYLNNEKMGVGLLKCQSWQDLRLYTSKQSKITVNNLKIKEK
jgi:hypothetical protein